MKKNCFSVKFSFYSVLYIQLASWKEHMIVCLKSKRTLLETFINKSCKSLCFSASHLLNCSSYWRKNKHADGSKKRCHPVPDFLFIPTSIPQYCWSFCLGCSYTVFQECRLKSDMPGPRKHNRGQKPQRITHNQSPKEFPWKQLLTRRRCSGREGRRAAETPDLNSMDSTAGDCLT